MNIAEALSGRAGPEGLQDLLRSSQLRNVLRRELKALLSVPEMLGRCRLRKVRFRVSPDVKLTAYFDVGVRRESAGAYGTRAVAVAWKPRWIGYVSLSGPKTEVTQIEDEAMRRGVATPFRRLAGQASACGMRIQVSPLDKSFPQLVRLSDPEYVSRKIATLCTSTHLTSGLGPQSRYTVTAIRYVPGQRHVLRFDSLDLSARSTVFAKLYNRGQTRRICQVVKGAAEMLKASGEEVAALQPLGCVPDDGVVFYPRLSGQPLHLLLRRGGREAGQALILIGRAIRTLHDAPPSFVDLLEPQSFEREIEEILHACGHITVLLPPMGSTIDTLLNQARELHGRLAQEPPTFTHGDPKAEHSWIAPNGLTLMDFDTSHRTDPALDLGKFLADLRWWFDSYGQNGTEEAHERFLAGYAPGVARHRLVRARLYEVLELIKVAGYYVRLSEPDWEARVSRLVRHAQALMKELRHRHGSSGKQFSSKGIVAVLPSVGGISERRVRFSAKGGRV